jgi:putative membrane protein
MAHWPPNTFLGAVLSTVFFGLIGILLTVFGLKLFDWITPSINIEKELTERHNLAVAIVTAAMILGAAIVIAAALVG